ncbi:family 93 putative glycoside hydrolase [Triangularia setosa]|uniref:Family 93 putative glycoside hydrolase n=1 Tax=Triangularia setosa TaxID=2587417 RepID=A0AAN7AA60_9PEZI|nr:family 93 putative glycoside hydrolase [Podospora setosa]
MTWSAVSFCTESVTNNKSRLALFANPPSPSTPLSRPHRRLHCCSSFPSVNFALVSMAHYLLSKLGVDFGERDNSSNDPPALPQLQISPDDHFPPSTQGTYPRLCQLSDGSLLKSYTAFGPEGERILTVSRSTDQACSFHHLGEITRSHGDCDNCFLLELRPGIVLATFRNHDLHPEHNKPTWFRITVCRSEDGGRTWEYLSQAVEKGTPDGVWEPFMRMGVGRQEVQLYYSAEGEQGQRQDTMVVVSSDGGENWLGPRTVTGEEGLRDGMIGVTEMRDRVTGQEALVMVMETTRYGPGRFNIEAVISYDEGLSWGSRQGVYKPNGENRNAGSPQIGSLAGGEGVVVVFMTDEDGDGGVWPAGATIKAVVGIGLENGRVNWSQKAEVVFEEGSSWPGILAVGHAEVLAVCERKSKIGGRLLRLDL